MSLRWMRPTVALAAIALTASGCAMFATGNSPTGTELTEPIVFAGVASIDEGACPADRPNAYESRLQGAQCIVIDPDTIIETEGGTVALVAASEQAPDVPESIEIALDDPYAERLRALTASLAAQEAPRSQLMIAVGGEVRAMPVVMDELTGNTVSISGNGLTALYDRLTE